MAEIYKRNSMVINNVKVEYRNFAGRRKTVIKNGIERVVNDEGNRNFTVSLDPEKSEMYFNDEHVTNPDFGSELQNPGLDFKVTFKPGQEEGEPGKYLLQCNLNYIADYIRKGKEPKKKSDPEFYMVVGNNEPILLDADTVDQLDFADIIGGTIWLNDQKPYTLNDGTIRNKFWCNKAYFVVREDKYADFENQYRNPGEVNEEIEE